MIETAKEKLSKRAFAIKKAWLVGCSWVGFIPDYDALEIPDYTIWRKENLERLNKDLYVDFSDLLAKIIQIESKKQIEKAIIWFSDKFQICLVDKRSEPFTICTAQEFEREVGNFAVRNQIEVPAYAEVLYQGWGGGVAIRHPEYMLSRDLEFLFFLNQTTEKYLGKVDWGNKDPMNGSASENSQTIARCGIQTCFNLLESFTSGIARQFLLTTPNLDEDIKSKLIDNTSPLKRRLIEVPKLVTGNPPPLDYNKSPLKEFFGHIKHRRDSFVHCEPGKQDTKWGYIKEEMFNNVSSGIVEDSVQATVSIIQVVWRHVYGNAGPRWLPQIDDLGKMENRNLNLAFPSPLIS